MEALALEQHISALRAKHTSLEEAIRVESSRPMPDFFVIGELKRKKLKVKEEIEQFDQKIPVAS